jgi:hypothetical protein
MTFGKEVDEKPSNASETETTAIELRNTVAALFVVDQVSYDLANEYNKRAYATEKAFHEFDDPVHGPIVEAWQKSCARRKKVLDAIKYIKEITGSRAAAWMEAEKEKARETKRIAEEAAIKAAEDAQLKAAEDLQAAGLTNAATAILGAPVVIPKVAIEAPAKADGVYYTDRYSAEVVDLMALVKAVAEGKAPLSAVCANDTYIGQWARMSKGTESLPGVKVLKEARQGRKL